MSAPFRPRMRGEGAPPRSRAEAMRKVVRDALPPAVKTACGATADVFAALDKLGLLGERERKSSWTKDEGSKIIYVRKGAKKPGPAEMKNARAPGIMETGIDDAADDGRIEVWPARDYFEDRGDGFAGTTYEAVMYYARLTDVVGPRSLVNWLYRYLPHLYSKEEVAEAEAEKAAADVEADEAGAVLAEQLGGDGGDPPIRERPRYGNAEAARAAMAPAAGDLVGRIITRPRTGLRLGLEAYLGAGKTTAAVETLADLIVDGTINKDRRGAFMPNTHDLADEVRDKLIEAVADRRAGKFDADGVTITAAWRAARDVAARQIPVIRGRSYVPEGADEPICAYYDQIAPYTQRGHDATEQCARCKRAAEVCVYMELKRKARDPEAMLFVVTSNWAHMNDAQISDYLHDLRFIVFDERSWHFAQRSTRIPVDWLTEEVPSGEAPDAPLLLDPLDKHLGEPMRLLAGLFFDPRSAPSFPLTAPTLHGAGFTSEELIRLARLQTRRKVPWDGSRVGGGHDKRTKFDAALDATEVNIKVRRLRRLLKTLAEWVKRWEDCGCGHGCEKCGGDRLGVLQRRRERRFCEHEKRHRIVHEIELLGVKPVAETHAGANMLFLDFKGARGIMAGIYGEIDFPYEPFYALRPERAVYTKFPFESCSKTALLNWPYRREQVLATIRERCRAHKRRNPNPILIVTFEAVIKDAGWREGLRALSEEIGVEFEIKWWNATRGLDKYKNYAGAITIGAPWNAPPVFERATEALTGRPAARDGERRWDGGVWWRHGETFMCDRDGAVASFMAPVHKDPMTAEMLDQIASVEILQVLGRLRALNRAGEDIMMLEMSNQDTGDFDYLDHLVQPSTSRGQALHLGAHLSSFAEMQQIYDKDLWTSEYEAGLSKSAAAVEKRHERADRRPIPGWWMAIITLANGKTLRGQFDPSRFSPAEPEQAEAWLDARLDVPVIKFNIVGGAEFENVGGDGDAVIIDDLDAMVIEIAPAGPRPMDATPPDPAAQPPPDE